MECDFVITKLIYGNIAEMFLIKFKVNQWDNKIFNDISTVNS